MCCHLSRHDRPAAGEPCPPGIGLRAGWRAHGWLAVWGQQAFEVQVAATATDASAPQRRTCADLPLSARSARLCSPRPWAVGRARFAVGAGRRRLVMLAARLPCAPELPDTHDQGNDESEQKKIRGDCVVQEKLQRPLDLADSVAWASGTPNTPSRHGQGTGTRRTRHGHATCPTWLLLARVGRHVLLPRFFCPPIPHTWRGLSLNRTPRRRCLTCLQVGVRCPVGVPATNFQTLWILSLALFAGFLQSSPLPRAFALLSLSGHAAFWSFTSPHTPMNATPTALYAHSPVDADPLSLGSHVQACRQAAGASFVWRCVGESVHAVLGPRMITTVLAATGLISLLTTVI